MDLDHVALGLRDVSDTLAALVGDLGATVLHGGNNVGFRVVQLRVGTRPRGGDPGDGMTVELIEPWATERFDFLERFLQRHGDGPHHLTFKAKDIRAQLALMAEAGFQPTSQNLDNPWWREAFFHPRDTFGTVIQIAQTDLGFDDDGEAGEDEEGEEHHRHEVGEHEFGPRRWWPAPPPRAERRAVLRRVVIRVPSLEPARALFADLLGGQAEAAGTDAIDLTWPGGARVRLVRQDGEPGIDCLECEWDGPDDERVVGGARLRLRSR